MHLNKTSNPKGVAIPTLASILMAATPTQAVILTQQIILLHQDRMSLLQIAAAVVEAELPVGLGRSKQLCD